MAKKVIWGIFIILFGLTAFRLVLSRKPGGLKQLLPKQVGQVKEDGLAGLVVISPESLENQGKKYDPGCKCPRSEITGKIKITSSLEEPVKVSVTSDFEQSNCYVGDNRFAMTVSKGEQEISFWCYFNDFFKARYEFGQEKYQFTVFKEANTGVKTVISLTPADFNL